MTFLTSDTVREDKERKEGRDGKKRKKEKERKRTFLKSIVISIHILQV